MEKKTSGQKVIRIMGSEVSTMRREGEGDPRDIPLIWWEDLKG